jgi:uncharacterized pyridoxamine 5'-phosphate oxidase family protein
MAGQAGLRIEKRVFTMLCVKKYNTIIIIKEAWTMGKGVEFLKEAGVYFIATSEDGQPQLRPFGSNLEYKGRFYFSMGRSKNVFKQMVSNPRVSLASMKPNRDWIRIIGEAVLDESEDVKNYMFESNPRIRDIYKDNTAEIAMFYLENATCIFFEAGKEPVQVDL